MHDPRVDPWLRRANRRTILRGSLGASAIALGGLSRWDAARAQAGTPTATDPLPSWNEGPVKRELIDFLDLRLQVEDHPTRVGFPMPVSPLPDPSVTADE